MRAADFTTYINAVEDPALDRKFDRLANQGARAFGTITQAANQASAAAAGLLQGRGSAGLGNTATTRGLQQQATEMRNVARASQDVARRASEVARGEREAAAAAGVAAREHQAFARSLNATSTALNVVQGPLGPLAGRVSAVSRALTSLTGLQLGTAAFGALGFTVARLGNNFQQLEGRLRPYLDTQRQVNGAMRDIALIAHQSRAGLEPVADLYTKLTQSAERYGMTQARVARITRLASQAATLSGGSTQSREAGLYQFAQGISSNRLGGDELRSLLENLPALADAIAKGMGVTTGALREMGAAGALSAKQVTQALERSASVIEERFNRLPPTLSSAATELRNNLTLIVGEFDRTIGLSSALTSLLMAIAGNLREITSLALGVGAAFAVVWGTRRISAFINSIVAANVQQIRMARLAEGITVATRAQSQAEAAAAAQRSVAAARDLANARSRRIAIQQNIAAIAAERRALQTGVLSTGVGTGFSRTAYRAALVEEQRLTRQLQIATGDLTRAKIAETGAKVANTSATRANSVAQGQLAATTRAGAAAAGGAAARSGILAGALRLVGGAGGIAGIAIAGLTTAAIYYATKQSEATDATERARQVMEDYANIVDQTTGRVRALTQAEGERTRVQAEKAVSDFERGSGAALRRQMANELRARGRFAPTPTGFPTPASVGAGANTTVGGQAYSPLPGTANYNADYRQKLLSSRWGAQYRQAEDFERLARQMESGAVGYTRSIDEINRRANAGEGAFVDYRNKIRDTTLQMADLGAAAKQGRQNLNILNGGLDPRWVEQRAQEEAGLASKVARTNSEYERRAKREDTRNDNARFEQNLEEAYRNFGVPSPEDIEQIRTRIRTLQAQPIPKGQDRLRKDALAGLNAELATAIERNNRYKGTVEASARALTTAQTAQRDENRELRQTNKERREAIDLAKDAAAAALNRGLVNLEQNRPALGEREYTRQRLALLATYDEEINKLDERQASSSRATTALIQNLRREAAEFERLDQRRTEILGRYTDEPRASVRAGRDIQVLRDAQRQLGEGFYPKETLDRDVAAIEFGLRRPFRELLKDHERQREVQLLILQGRETEARVLERVYQLVDSQGEVTADEYAQLLANAQEQERINDILARRERIVGMLQGSVEEARGQLEQFLLDVQNDGAKAGANLWNGLSRRLQQATVRQFVERITAGADEKVRALLSGRNAVESASRTFASQIQSTASEVVSLADASRTTAATMINAAEDIRRGVASALSGAAEGTITPGTSRQQRGQEYAPATERVLTRVEKMLQPLNLGGRRAAATSNYGWRTNPITGQRQFHGALDLPAAFGTAVRAAFSGKVTQAGPNGLLGNSVTIDHGNNLRTIYGHLSSIQARVGQLVTQGTDIGGVGSTGRSTGNHLHFAAQRFDEASRKWVAINPSQALNHTVEVATRTAAKAVSSAIVQAPARRRVAGQPTGRLDSMGDVLAGLSDPGAAGVTPGALPTDVRQGIEATVRLMTEGGSSPSRMAELDALVNGAEMTERANREQRRGSSTRPRDVYNEFGKAVGEGLDKVFNSGQFFSKIGKNVGTALEGSAQGQMASGLARQLGIKQSKTGAAIGGAAGAVAASALGLPPELGGFIGGLWGGTIGGALKKTKTGTATIGMTDSGGYGVTGTRGNSKNRIEAAETAGNNLVASLEDIARGLFGSVGEFGSLSIGVRDKKYVVDPSGKGKTKGGATKKFESEQEAIAYALELAISRGAIQGISAASQRILQSGKDLQRALEKATIIESIPRRLLARTNPVLGAVQDLNREFAYMIQVLKEAGATGQQFSDAQKLYELERAEAVKQSAQSMFGAIEDYLKEMMGGSTSPLNRRTVFENAQAEINKFVGDIQGGKVVDQDDLLEAAKNFQEASGQLKGRGPGFFDDFDWLAGLLTKAKTNAQGLVGDTSAPLPPSPFDDPSVNRMIEAYRGTETAVKEQTGVLGGVLDEVLEELRRINGAGGGGGGGSLVGVLPGFGRDGGGLGGRFANLPTP